MGVCRPSRRATISVSAKDVKEVAGGTCGRAFSTGRKSYPQFPHPKRHVQKRSKTENRRQVPTKNSKKAPDSALPILTFRPANRPNAPENAGCPLKRGCFRPFRAPP